MVFLLLARRETKATASLVRSVPVVRCGLPQKRPDAFFHDFTPSKPSHSREHRSSPVSYSSSEWPAFYLMLEVSPLTTSSREQRGYGHLAQRSSTRELLVFRQASDLTSSTFRRRGPWSLKWSPSHGPEHGARPGVLHSGPSYRRCYGPLPPVARQKHLPRGRQFLRRSLPPLGRAHFDIFPNLLGPDDDNESCVLERRFFYECEARDTPKRQCRRQNPVAGRLLVNASYSSTPLADVHRAR